MFRLLVKFGILLSIISFWNSIVFAQKTCNLQFGIYEFKDDGTAEQFPVNNSKIIFVNAKSNKPLKVSNSVNLATVSNIIEGEYKVTVSKNGFQNTVKEFLVDCSFADTQNIVSEIVFLWKGNSKQTFLQGFKESGAFTISEKDSDIDKEVSNVVNLVKPIYPKAAIAVGAKGKVNVQITINELGYVISAKAVSGHALLHQASVEAAKKSKYQMTLLQGIPVKITGIIVYNFG